MKKILLTSVMLLALTGISYAQSGFSYLGIRSGYTIEKGYTANIFYNMPATYNNSFELGAQYFTASIKNNKDAYRNILGSLVYKSQITRSVNTAFSMVMGGAVGSDLNKIIAGPQFGFEVNQYLGGADLVFSNRNEYIFLTNKDHRLRFNFEFGIRFPLN